MRVFWVHLNFNCKQFLLLVLQLIFFIKGTAQVSDRFIRAFDKTPLAENTVYVILQDAQKYLWFGTYNGLIKYDGYNFITLSASAENDSLLYPGPVVKLIQSKSGLLWIGIKGSGLQCIDPKTGKVKYFIADGKKSKVYKLNNISEIVEDKLGNLWISSHEEGLFYFNTSTGKIKQFLSGENNLASEKVSNLAIAPNQVLWLGFYNGKVQYYDEKTGAFVYLDKIDVGGNPMIKDILADHKGRIWIAAGVNVSYYDPKTNKQTLVEGIFNSYKGILLTAEVLFEDNTNQLWIGTSFKGLYSYNEGTNKVENRASTNSTYLRTNTDCIRSIGQDKANNLYIGTCSGTIKITGVYSIIKSIKPVTDDDKNGLNSIRDIFTDKDGTVWMGGKDAILVKYPKNYNKQVLSLPSPARKVYRYINAISDNRKGELLIGTTQGLAVLDKHTLKVKDSFFYDYENITEKGFLAAVWAIAEDDNNIVWLGLKDSGLVSYDIKNKKFVRHRNLFKSKQTNVSVWCIYKGSEKCFWLGTSEGLKQLIINGPHKATIIHHNLFLNIETATGNVFDIYEDAEKCLWLASTDGGLIQYNYKTKFTRYFTTKHGMPTNTVCGVLEDKVNNIWASTTNGIVVINKKTAKIIKYIEASDGLFGNHFNFGACALNPKGEFIFAGANGVNVINPERLPNATYKPNIVLTSFKVLYDEKINELADVENIDLNYNENAFSVEFASLDFTKPEKNTFAYILEGLDKEWTYSGTRRFASYTNLEPGNYTLKIKGTNSDGIWSDKVLTYNIKIATPYWQTWWFYASEGLAAIAVSGYSIFLVFRRKEYRRKRITAELSALRAQLNPHFVFNSLSALQSFIATKKDELALQYLAKFARLMRMILVNSKSELISLEEETIFLNHYIYMESIRVDNKVDFVIETDPSLNAKKTMIPPMLLQPLIENSIIHGLVARVNNGTVMVKFKKDNNMLVCSVEDNGVGRQQAIANSALRNHNSKSFGLKITKERVEALVLGSTKNAELNITDLYNSNGLPSGTKIEIRLPLLVN